MYLVRVFFVVKKSVLKVYVTVLLPVQRKIT